MNNFVKIYGIKNCDTVKKALNYLIDNDVSYEFIDFRKSPLSSKEFQAMIDSVGSKLLINKRSTTYRSLTENQKNKIDYDLVIKFPTLIKRPVLVNGDNIMVGYSEKEYEIFFTK